MPSQALQQRHGMEVSTEHYLRAILELREERGYARMVDIATRLDVTKGSASIAIGNLKNRGLVQFDTAHFPELTSTGRSVALSVRTRYRVVVSFLTEILGLPLEQATAEACRWEHVVSPEAADRLLDFMHFAVDEPARQAALQEFRAFHRSCADQESCPTCTAKRNPAGPARAGDREGQP